MAVFHLDHHENNIRPVSIDTAWNFACETVSDDAWSVDHIAGISLLAFEIYAFLYKIY
jgi:hypothetical protein